ncbi:hypothetical protein OPT61_g526 [Boeremia exigua]|uniref:Uncharacterized protein n=1 Tax=Boeremia exigua TaxID=749465 RepID=A0ACC2ITJ8_9PLEO|nr:hypothetical protein OPT61_g526 [Boeremia exigua]
MTQLVTRPPQSLRRAAPTPGQQSDTGSRSLALGVDNENLVLFETLESRLAALENSMAMLDNRVTGIEMPKTKDVNTERVPSQAQHQPFPNSASLGPETGSRSSDDAKDPTDGIGSMTFTQEEESGFFALTRQIVQATTAVLHAKASAASPETTSHTALQGFMFHATRSSSPVDGSPNLRTASREKVDPFALPAEGEALRLMRQYFTTTGSLFPYLDEDAFVRTYQQLASSNVYTPTRSWLALLNMVLAMATHAGRDKELCTPETEGDSDLFFQRALYDFGTTSFDPSELREAGPAMFGFAAFVSEVDVFADNSQRRERSVLHRDCYPLHYHGRGHRCVVRAKVPGLATGNTDNLVPCASQRAALSTSLPDKSQATFHSHRPVPQPPDTRPPSGAMQVGANSIRICAEAAFDIIAMMHQVLTGPDSPRHLLGAWWFSLYYTFNAALVIYAILLVQHEVSRHDQGHVIEGSKLDSSHLDSAIACLSLLSEGNRMSEKCFRYTSSLAKTLSMIRHLESHQDALGLLNLPNDPLVHGQAVSSFNDDLQVSVPAFPGPGDLHMGVTLEDFLGTDFDFVTSFKAPNLVS